MARHNCLVSPLGDIYFVSHNISAESLAVSQLVLQVKNMAKVQISGVINIVPFLLYNNPYFGQKDNMCQMVNYVVKNIINYVMLLKHNNNLLTPVL